MENETFERFIVGHGEASHRMYLTHTRHPRFIAELFDDDGNAPVSGLALVLPESGEVLSNFMWIDDPAGCDVNALRDDVAAFLDESDFRAEMEIDAEERREDQEDGQL